MKVKTAVQRGWRYVFIMSALLAGLWLVGSASADPQAGRDLGLKTAPSFTAPLPTGSDLASPADTPTALLVAHVTWQGISQPNSHNTTQTITLTLRLAGGGPYFDYTNMTTDANGYFTVSVDTLGSGTYNYRVKGPRNLSNGGSVVLAGDPVTNIEMGLMRAGDALTTGPANFDVVNAADFIVLKNSAGRFCTFEHCDRRADFNNNDVIDATDFSLMKSNYGSSGAPPIGP
jgi:hypothetical protein